MDAGLAVIDGSDYCHKVLRDEAGGAADEEITHRHEFQQHEEEIINASRRHGPEKTSRRRTSRTPDGF